MAKASRRQFLVTISGIPGRYVSRSGGESSAPVSKAYDGGERVPDLVGGLPEVSNVVCGRHFDPDRDAALVARLRLAVGNFTATIQVQPTDFDFVPTGPATVYPAALLTRVGDVQPDAESGDLARYELEFAVAAVA